MWTTYLSFFGLLLFVNPQNLVHSMMFWDLFAFHLLGSSNKTKKKSPSMLDSFEECKSTCTNGSLLGS